MKKVISLLLISFLLINGLVVSAESFGTLPSYVLCSESVTLKSGEYAHYERSDLENGAYDVYLKGNQKTGITLAVGADRYLQLVVYEIESEENYLGRLIIENETQNIRIENTGTSSFTYNNLYLKKVTAIAEISVNQTSTSPQSEVLVSGNITDYSGDSKIKLKSEIFENDEKKSEIYYDINTQKNVKTEFEETITASGDKMIFTIWDTEKEIKISEEKTLYIGENHHIYVFAGAKENGDGTKMNPFNSIALAQGRVREINGNMNGDIIVHLSGKFNINEKLVFDERDSGSNGFKIVWDGENNAEISGEKVLGELPRGSKMLLGVLAGAWALILLYGAIQLVKSKRNPN